ncbi:MAG: glutamate--tRNA ligase [Candidatus Adiutrix sp.]|jgi:glutamyl-tRNA synthetase|nr:glutamate--tRNA ligase [Candidatus Adiutrix sp.]
MSNVVTRFAPSPTGHLHVGGARTALFNWLLARRQGGRFVLRIGDTDALRSTPEFTRDILGALDWLKLDWDGEPVYQSRRLDIHRAYIERLLAQGRAYWCHCRPEDLETRRQAALAAGGKPKYDGRCRDVGLGPAPGAVVRFRGPEEGETGWTDIIKGPVSFAHQELDDLILLRGDNQPTYNLAVVADDIEMGITHIVRGDDHVNNTPRQILLYRALEAPLPKFAHVPMILGADKTRLSKRHGATSVMAYREAGYLPEALINYLARLGWSHGDLEIFSLEEMRDLFDLAQVGRSAGVFNPEKLNWLNAHYIKGTDPATLGDLVWPYLAAKGYARPPEETLAKIMLTVRERGQTLPELAAKADFYFPDLPEMEPAAAAKFLTAENLALLKELRGPLSEPGLTPQAFEELLRGLAAAKGLKLSALAQPLRVALTGRTASPGLFEILEILGPEKTRRRLEAVITPEI